MRRPSSVSEEKPSRLILEIKQEDIDLFLSFSSCGKIRNKIESRDSERNWSTCSFNLRRSVRPNRLMRPFRFEDFEKGLFLFGAIDRSTSWVNTSDSGQTWKRLRRNPFVFRGRSGLCGRRLFSHLSNFLSGGHKGQSGHIFPPLSFFLPVRTKYMSSFSFSSPYWKM